MGSGNVVGGDGRDGHSDVGVLFVVIKRGSGGENGTVWYAGKEREGAVAVEVRAAKDIRVVVSWLFEAWACYFGCGLVARTSSTGYRESAPAFRVESAHLNTDN